MPNATTWDELLHPGDAVDFFQRRKFPPFSPGDKNYNPGNALWLAELSRLVYRHDLEEDKPPPKPTRSRFLYNTGLQQLDFFLSTATDTQAMLVAPMDGPKFAALVFRGTEANGKDFLTDLELGKLGVAGKKIDVHEGFREALDSVWSKIDDSLSGLDCPLFFTGHSLGAALATLAAARRQPSALYTFGSPKVGNQAFVDSLAATRIYRVVDDEDIVATLPPGLGYVHAGAEQRLLAPPKTKLIEHLFDPPKPLADHAPVNYVDRIRL